MRLLPPLLFATLLAACHPSSPQADALDNAAAQADPAAAAEMRNQADTIRDGGGNGAALADPSGAAQQAMARAGAAQVDGREPKAEPAFGTNELVAGRAPAATPDRAQDSRGAKPHRAGDPVPNTTKPTPVANHY